MKIVEKDFKIEYDGECFILSLLKSKKELKEDAAEIYKVHGYYKISYNALKAAYNWRLHKKYPFKEPTAEFKKYLLRQRQAMNLLETYSQLIYNPIYEFKTLVFNGTKGL